MSKSNRAPIYFWIPDLETPEVEEPLADEHGHRIEVSGFRPSDHAPREARLFWGWKKEPPDMIHHVSRTLFVSEKARQCWGLRSDDTMSLRQVSLVNREKTVFRTDYWWVDVHPDFPIVDREESVINRPGPVLLWVERIAVAWDNVPDLPIFLSSEFYAQIFSHALVTRYQDCELTGALFVSVDGASWPPRNPTL